MKFFTSLRYSIWHLISIVIMGCGQPFENKPNQNQTVSAFPRVTEHNGKIIKGPLLLTRFKSFDELRQVVHIEYSPANTDSASRSQKKSSVHLTQVCNDGRSISATLASGISQQDIANARKGNLWDKLVFTLQCPYAVFNRNDMKRIYALSRRRDVVFGARDVAFYDIAETMTYQHLVNYEEAVHFPEDLSEKGYINTFNHIAAQAFMTTLFSERMAQFIAVIHERYNMPEVMTGDFTPEQIANLDKGATDNYVDIINNAWGQQLGLALKTKFGITRGTKWTPHLMADYLNDLQGYCAWAFDIGFRPFRPTDDLVVKFSSKLNQIMHRAPEVEVRRST